MKALFHFAAGPGLKALLEESGSDGLRFTCVDEADDARYFQEIADSEILCHVLKPVTASMLERAPKLKLIQKIGVGVNTIDLEAARAHDVAVCNMPGTNSQAVAEMTLALILATLRRMTILDRQIRQPDGWVVGPQLQGHFGEVSGRRIGLCGFGAVPRLLAPVLAALGAEVIYTTRQPAADVPYRHVDKATLIAQSDILSLHMPLTEETRNYLDAEALAAMKPGAILINTARGELVDQSALARLLERGAISAAGLDVFAQEPIDAEAPILQLDNVVATPHVAWLTRETLLRSLAVVRENHRRLAVAEPLLHRVI